MEAQTGLPPRPRMSRPVQTAIWSRQAQWMLSQCRRRLGPMFTLEIAYEGKWVVVSDPELVKEIFRGDPKVFHAGEGNDDPAAAARRATRCWSSTTPRT